MAAACSNRAVPRRERVDGGGEILVRLRRQLLEGLRDVAHPSVRRDDEEAAVVELVLVVPRAVAATDLPRRVAGEEHRELCVAGPAELRGIRVDADTDHGDVPAVVEERGVLITVRLHLNRSALCPCLVEEGDHHRLSTVVGEAHRVGEQPVPRRTAQREVGSDAADRYDGRRRGGWLLGASRDRGENRGKNRGGRERTAIAEAG